MSVCESIQGLTIIMQHSFVRSSPVAPECHLTMLEKLNHVHPTDAFFISNYRGENLLFSFRTFMVKCEKPPPDLSPPSL